MNVSLKIYDALGRKISTLVAGEFETGKYSYQWNADNYSSGLYYYRLQTLNYTETKKMLLIK